MIRIIAKKDGFRRAGVAHTGSKLWPDGTFTPEQLAALQAEPNLIVEEFSEEVFVEEAGEGEYALIETGEEGKANYLDVPELLGPLRAAPDIVAEPFAAPEEKEAAPGKGELAPAIPPKDGKGKK